MINSITDKAGEIGISLSVLELGILKTTQQPRAVCYELVTDLDNLRIKAEQKSDAPFRAVAQQALNLANLVINMGAAQPRA